MSISKPSRKTTKNLQKSIVSIDFKFELNLQETYKMEIDLSETSLPFIKQQENFLNNFDKYPKDYLNYCCLYDPKMKIYITDKKNLTQDSLSNNKNRQKKVYIMKNILETVVLSIQDINDYLSYIENSDILNESVISTENRNSVKSGMSNISGSSSLSNLSTISGNNTSRINNKILQNELLIKKKASCLTLPNGKKIDIKSICLNLWKFYLPIPEFAKNFIENNGVCSLISIMEKDNSPNVKAYAAGALKILLENMNALQYVDENDETMCSFYYILMTNRKIINVTEAILQIFLYINKYFKLKPRNNFYDKFTNAIICYKNPENTDKKDLKNSIIYPYSSQITDKPQITSEYFEDFIDLIRDNSFEIKTMTLTLIVDILDSLPDKKNVSKTIALFEDAGINKILDENVNCIDPEFQAILKKYQEISKEATKESAYEVEKLKKKIKNYEKEFSSFQKQMEFVSQNNLYENFEGDFVRMKKLCDVCIENSGYFDPYVPIERYDTKLKRKIKVDKNGRVDLKSLVQEKADKDDFNILVRLNEMLMERNDKLREDNKMLFDRFKDFENKKLGMYECNDNISKDELLEQNILLKSKIDNFEKSYFSLDDDQGDEISNFLEDNGKELLESKILFSDDKMMNIKKNKKDKENGKNVKEKIALEMCNKICQVEIVGKRKESINDVVIRKKNVDNNEKNGMEIEVGDKRKEQNGISMSYEKTVEVKDKKIVEEINECRKIGDEVKIKDELKSQNEQTTIPSIPQIPSVPSIPSIPQVPSIPAIPSIPQIPGVPAIPSIPQVPSIPAIPSIPQIPGVPTIPSVPQIPSIPSIPEIPGVPSIPSIPQIPAIPSIPNLSIPGIPGIPPCDGIPQISFPMPIGIPQSSPPKPKIKFKSLNWKRIKLPATTNTENSLWKSINSVPINLEDIIKVFSIKPLSRTKTDAEKSKPVVPKKISFLDSKRNQSVGIIMAKLPPISEIERCLREFDDDLLPENKVEMLAREYITEAEIKEYQNYKNEPIKNFEKTESFLIQLYLIKNSKEKIIMWNFKNKYEETEETIDSVIEFTDDALTMLKNDKKIPLLFSYILTIGNILNENTSKGKAEGFNLDIILKLTDVKGEKNVNLLTYICKEIKKEDHNFGELTKHFEPLKNAMGNPYSESIKQWKEMESKYKNVKKYYDKLEKEDNFKTTILTFLKNAEKKFEDVNKKTNNIDSKFKDIINYFSIGKDDEFAKSPEGLIKHFYLFFQKVDQAIPVEKKPFVSKYKAGEKITDNVIRSLYLSSIK